VTLLQSTASQIHEVESAPEQVSPAELEEAPLEEPVKQTLSEAQNPND